MYFQKTTKKPNSTSEKHSQGFGKRIWWLQRINVRLFHKTGQRNNGKVVKWDSIYQCSKVWHPQSFSKHKVQMDTLPHWVQMLYSKSVFIHTHSQDNQSHDNTDYFTSCSSLFPWTLAGFTKDQEGSNNPFILPCKAQANWTETTPELNQHKQTTPSHQKKGIGEWRSSLPLQSRES